MAKNKVPDLRPRREPSEFDRFADDGLKNIQVTDPALPDSPPDEVPSTVSVTTPTYVPSAEVSVSPDGSHLVLKKKLNDEGLATVTTLTKGVQTPVVKFRDDADPLMVECYNLFRTLQAGGVLNPWCGLALIQVDTILMKLRKEVVDVGV